MCNNLWLRNPNARYPDARHGLHCWNTRHASRHASRHEGRPLKHRPAHSHGRHASLEGKTQLSAGGHFALLGVLISIAVFKSERNTLTANRSDFFSATHWKLNSVLSDWIRPKVKYIVKSFWQCLKSRGL